MRLLMTHLRTDPLQDILRGDFAQDDADEEQSLTGIELILRDANLDHEAIGQSVRDVASFQLEHIEAEKE